MSTKKLPSGTVHKIPGDLKKNILLFSEAKKMWESITPLARNEWICWVESAKKEETRLQRISRVCTELMEGKRRPCCWAGCVHR